MGAPFGGRRRALVGPRAPVSARQSQRVALDLARARQRVTFAPAARQVRPPAGPPPPDCQRPLGPPGPGARRPLPANQARAHNGAPRARPRRSPDNRLARAGPAPAGARLIDSRAPCGRRPGATPAARALRCLADSCFTRNWRPRRAHEWRTRAAFTLAAPGSPARLPRARGPAGQLRPQLRARNSGPKNAH